MVFSLQKALGHKNFEMTKRYVALTDADLHKEHKTASPVNSLISNINIINGIKSKKKYKFINSKSKGILSYEGGGLFYMWKQELMFGIMGVIGILLGVRVV